MRKVKCIELNENIMLLSLIIKIHFFIYEDERTCVRNQSFRNLLFVNVEARSIHLKRQSKCIIKAP